MTVNFLLLNSDKTEVIVIGLKHLQEALLSCTANLDHISLVSGSTVRNLGVIFDQKLSFNSHIKWVTKLAYFHLCNIRKIRNILNQGDAKN